MRSKRVGLLACLASILFVLHPSTLFSQMAGTGQIDGTVTDKSGGAVAEATVTLVDLKTNIERTAVTNEAGRYVFASVAPGVYSVTINRSGFRAAKFSDQQVEVGSTRTLNVTLELGSTTETVEVTATSADLQTMNATVGNTITGVALNSLPTIGRDVSTFVTLQPGVSPDGSVAGAIYDQNSFGLDGGNNSNDMDGSMNIYTPSAAGDTTGGLVTSYVTGNAGGGPTGVMPTPVDSIEELKVGTNNQTADFNSSAGAQVQMVTKRGTNSWHGTGYEYYYDNNWNGNTWDNNANGAPRDSFHYNRFGAAGGGPLIWKNILGGKWYFFGNYEGFRWPNTTTFYRMVPSDLMRQGILQFKDANGVLQQYNLNTANGPMAQCPAGPCDPRGLGISPTMQAMWQFEPEPTPGASCGNIGSRCDSLNTQAFRGTLALPWNENFGVARVDHDFGAKWHLSTTYHYYNLQRATSSQVDIGGFFPGDKLGVPTSVHKRPQQPSFYTIGLTTNITSHLTNDFHYSYLRNYWARYFTGGQGPGGAGVSQQPQLPELGGALQPGGETSGSLLAPYNLNTQSVRTRFWDGQDHMIRDDVSWIKGTHFLQFGGTYQHNFNWHLRTDNGGSVNNEIVYDLASGGGTNGNNVGSGVDMTGYVPAAISGVGGNTLKNWYRDYAILLGIPSLTQVAYTRTAPDLAAQPVGAPVFDQSTIPFYNLYFSDSWRMKPTFTLTYGLGWTLEMPPNEKNGKQIVMVGPDNKPISTEAYLKARETAALAGQVYNPDIGFSLVHNVAGNPKYPYNPYYKSFSPRIAAAWNPNFDSGLLADVFGHHKTVIRGGYSILYGRLNGVALLLTPLLSTGLIQPVQCFSPLSNGTCASSQTSTPNNAFRIGPTANGFDGTVAPITPALPTLPQPVIPGVNAENAGSSEALDPNFRPSMSHQFDVTVQRQINSKTTIEIGYIGRKYTHDLQAININAVPYMMTLGGQTFAQAFGQMAWQYCAGATFPQNQKNLAGGNCVGNLAAVTEQPFFKAALNPAYCASTGGNCAQAVAANEGGNIANNAVWSLWSDLDNGSFVFPRSMLNTPIPGASPCPGSAPTDPPCGAGGQLGTGVGMSTSLGYGNYNAGFISLKMSDWHGLTTQSNFTFGKALGTGSIVQATSQWTVPDAYNLRSAYGLQSWDRKFIYNLFFIYQPPMYKSQRGLVGRMLGGWSIAPILSMGSGLPNAVVGTDGNILGLYQAGGGQAWGQSDGSSSGFSSFENAVNMCGPGVGGSSRHNHPVPSTNFPDMGTAFFGPSMFQNPEAVYNCFRNSILGIDPSGGGGAGILRGQMYWNVDLGVRKDIMITERVHLQFDANFTNVFNHPILSDPYNVLGDTADWGALGSISGELITGAVQANAPRTIQLGLRLSF
jgi:Carboxypeptidase regulatory-like domain